MPDTPTFTTKIGGRRPLLLLQLLDDDGAAVDLTDAASATLVLEPHGGGTATTHAMTFFDRDDGKVQYAWAADDVDAAGAFDGEVKVVWDDGKTEFYPNSGTFLVVVEAAIS